MADTPTHEEKAQEHGWVPKEEWAKAGKSEGDWVDAREFNYRGELMGRITSQTNELKQLRTASSLYDKKLKKLGDAVVQLTNQNKKLAQRRLAEDKDELLHFRAEAEVEGDAAKMAAIDADLEKLKKAETDLEAETTVEEAAEEKQDGALTPDQATEMRAWIEQNPWYVTNPQASQYANFVAGTLSREDKSFTDYLNEVADAVGQVFRDIDTEEPEPRKGRTQRVLEPGANGATPRTSRSANHVSRLSETEREIGQTFVAEGVFKSLEDYAKHLSED